MKFNWGTGITLVYVSFVLFMVAMVTLCVKNDVYLVSDDYYKEEIAYQNKINSLTNSAKEPATMVFEDKKLHIHLPFPPETGATLLLYRPDNQKSDVSYSVAFQHGLIPLNSLKTGNWIAKLSWNKAGKNYFQQYRFNK